MPTTKHAGETWRIPIFFYASFQGPGGTPSEGSWQDRSPRMALQGNPTYGIGRKLSKNPTIPLHNLPFPPKYYDLGRKDVFSVTDWLVHDWWFIMASYWFLVIDKILHTFDYSSSAFEPSLLASKKSTDCWLFETGPIQPFRQTQFNMEEAESGTWLSWNIANLGKLRNAWHHQLLLLERF